MSSKFYECFAAARAQGCSPAGATRLALCDVLPSGVLDRDDGVWVASCGSRSAVGWTPQSAAEKLVAVVVATGAA